MATNQTDIGYYQTLGILLWLMNHSPYHSQWPIWSVDADIIPPLLQGQCKVYFDEAQNPVGCVTWAWLDEAAKQQLLANEQRISLDQWSAGDQLMFADFIAPWGHAKAMLRDLRQNVFHNEKRAFSLGRNPDGSIRKIYEWLPPRGQTT